MNLLSKLKKLSFLILAQKWAKSAIGGIAYNKDYQRNRFLPFIDPYIYKCLKIIYIIWDAINTQLKELMKPGRK